MFDIIIMIKLTHMLAQSHSSLLHVYVPSVYIYTCVQKKIKREIETNPKD